MLYPVELRALSQILQSIFSNNLNRIRGRGRGIREFGKTTGLKIVALVGVRTINAVQVDFVLVDRHRVRSPLVSPTSGKLHVYFSELIYGPILNLNSAEFTIPIRCKIERTMFCQRHENRKSLLKKVNLSLQDSQVALILCVV